MASSAGHVLMTLVKTTTWKVFFTCMHCHRQRRALDSLGVTDYSSRSITSLLEHHLHWSFFQHHYIGQRHLCPQPVCPSRILLHRYGLGVWKAHLKGNAQEGQVSWVSKEEVKSDLVMMGRPAQGENVQDWQALQPSRGASYNPLQSSATQRNSSEVNKIVQWQRQ